ncbi:MAG: polysaccharide biosynthesis/export family protein [Pseudomonadota bacterium]
MKRGLVCVSSMITILGVASCASGGSTPEYPSSFESSAPPDANLTKVELDTLLIGPADMLEIKVFGVPELDGRYQVDYLGRIKVPLVGEVNAMGLSTYELSGVLEDELEKSYLQNAQVNVIVEESADALREFTIEGSVNKPGIFPVAEDMTLLQAVAVAGGPSEFANPRKVVVFRTIDGERSAAAFDLIAIRAGTAGDPQIYPDDIVVMDGSEVRSGYREVIRSIPIVALFLAL